jgi:hypothetical protein
VSGTREKKSLAYQLVFYLDIFNPPPLFDVDTMPGWGVLCVSQMDKAISAVLKHVLYIHFKISG